MCQEPRVLFKFEMERSRTERDRVSPPFLAHLLQVHCASTMTPQRSSSDHSSCDHWLYGMDFFFLFFKVLWSSGIHRKAWKQKCSGTEVCDAIPQSLDGFTRAAGTSRRPSHQALGCLPSLLLLRFSCLSPQTHLQACTCSPPFQEFYYCFQDGKKKKKKRINLNSARASRAQQEGMRVELLGMWMSNESRIKLTPGPSTGVWLWVGEKKQSQWEGSGPHQPPRGHQPPADFRQATVALYVCFPPAEHKQKQLGPALLRPTSRLAICTHAQRAVPSYNSGNVFHTRDRGANDNPRRWHIHRLPGWAPLTPPPPPPPPAPLPRRLLLLSPPGPHGGKQPSFRGVCFLLSSKQSSLPSPPLSHQLGSGDRFLPWLPASLSLESPISQRISSDNV